MQNRHRCCISIDAEEEGARSSFLYEGEFEHAGDAAIVRYTAEGDRALLVFYSESLEMRREGIGLSARFCAGERGVFRADCAGCALSLPFECTACTLRPFENTFSCDLIYRLFFPDHAVFRKLHIFIVISEEVCK